MALHNGQQIPYMACIIYKNNTQIDLYNTQQISYMALYNTQQKTYNAMYNTQQTT